MSIVIPRLMRFGARDDPGMIVAWQDPAQICHGKHETKRPSMGPGSATGEGPGTSTLSKEEIHHFFNRFKKG